MSNQNLETVDLTGLSVAYENEIQINAKVLENAKTSKSKSHLEFSGLPEAYGNEIECSVIEAKSSNEIEPERNQNEEYSKHETLPGSETIENQPNKIEHEKHEPTSSLTKGIRFQKNKQRK